jgi:hypothetical protein
MSGSVPRSKRLVIAVETPSELRKIFQVQFSDKDGSVFVNFPYFIGVPGVVSLVDWPVSDSPSTILSLEPGGKVSSHLVKYSHHPDGRAHFSQDGRVYTEIKKQSVPLSAVEGHLFTLHVHGLHGFQLGTDRDRVESPSSKRMVVRFPLDDPPAGSIKFVGRLHSLEWLKERTVSGEITPTLQLLQPDGSLRHAFVWSSLLGTPAQGFCMVISIELQARLDQSRTTSLLFVGGFDTREVMNDLSMSVSFLALSYPAEDLDDLRARLGSIDFRRERAS